MGLTAVALSKAAVSCPHLLPSRFIVTDYCAQVLQNMDSTLAANGIDFSSQWQDHPPQAPPPHAFIVSDLLDVRDARACAEFALLHQVRAALSTDFLLVSCCDSFSSAPSALKLPCSRGVAAAGRGSGRRHHVRPCAGKRPRHCAQLLGSELLSSLASFRSKTCALQC